MKTALMIVMAMATAIIISLTTGCFIQENIALNKAKEAEQIEFSKTKEEIIKFDSEWWKIIEEDTRLDEENLKSLGEALNDDQKFDNVIAKMQKDYEDYILKFKSLTIPKPLDEFYYKKIEQFNATETGTLDKATELQLEAQKIQREVYREYGLDDLIQKWQEIK